MPELTNPTTLEPEKLGSPFARGTESAVPMVERPESIGEGVWRETAVAAANAAWMLVAFAVAAWVWFPAGGIAIAVLGITIAILGLGSRMAVASMIALLLHLTALAACYLALMQS